MNNTKNSLFRIPQIDSNESFFVVERKNYDFICQLHTHQEYEITFIENALNAQRVIGDSIETIGEYDLVIIANEQLYHYWHIGDCNSMNAREITIKFPKNLIQETLLDKNQFQSINRMFELAKRGIAFPNSTILKVKSLFYSLINEQINFNSVMVLFSMIYELSVSNEIRILASNSFIKPDLNVESRRVSKVIHFLEQNYSADLNITEIAKMTNMTTESFSRFFKKSTGKSFTDYLTDFRIGKVTRQLIDTSKSVAEISYECGFKNISNFNRIFKKKKKSSPRRFREIYRNNQSND
jgi:AraC-like DNA-binding protein